MVALTWKEARRRLRELLLEYIDGPPPPLLKAATLNKEERQDYNNNSDALLFANEKNSWLSTCTKLWLGYDLDLISALLFSVALLLLTSFSLENHHDGKGNNNNNGSSILNAHARNRIYRSQVAAAVLLVVSSLTAIWMVRRRHRAGLRDVDSVKRREIQRFLKSMENKVMDNKGGFMMAGNDGAATTTNNNVIHHHHDYVGDANPQGSDSITSSVGAALEALKLPGTSLTDIYPIYRLAGNGQGSWTRIPILLLVQGDYVALQVGDIAPARCKAINMGGEGTVEMQGGDRITLESLGESVNWPKSNLPKGRTTLPPESDKLLTLCNDLRIYVLLESPLYEFLRQPQVEHKEPLLLRQLQAIRGALSLLALGLFILTVVIIFARPDFTSTDLSLVLPIPLLAPLGVLPIGAPAFLIFLEVLGTARILTAVHPHTSVNVASQIQGSGTSQNGQQRNENAAKKDKVPLLTRYFLATTLARLSLKEGVRKIRIFYRSVLGRGATQSTLTGDIRAPKILRIPPASNYLLEKLGVATAFTLVDDELACEPNSLPQQLLIPSGSGLKLLDLYPTYDDKSGEDESTAHSSTDFARKRNESFDSNDHDSDTDSDTAAHQSISASWTRTKKNMFPLRRNRRRLSPLHTARLDNEGHSAHEHHEEQHVQFEDPNWWQHLPALKCIGLACLIVDEKVGELDDRIQDRNRIGQSHGCSSDLQEAKQALVRLISAERRSNQLRALAHCIGFSMEPNSSGEKGDLSPFAECLRLHVISYNLVKERLEIDAHERGSEEARWWGLLRPDSTSVMIKDARSNAYQLLTAGDPSVVTSLCHEAWQGENSTILPLASADRATILDTSRSWKLADLDVTAFSYSPVPYTVEKRLGTDSPQESKSYLLDRSTKTSKGPISLKDKSLSEEWSLINNQIFLGMLGSLVVPRKEIQQLLSTLSDAGVRFVYFSPRNMRRQKELASQMGIDVAWNCAISLRPLESGEDDPHRMVSNYADWDVNAKLPHGLENVRKHLKEVDNVPLLVSLFTDVTKRTTMGMIETFQEYADTVITVGLSHLPRNSAIFSTADIAVGIDVFADTIEHAKLPHDLVNKSAYNRILPSEATFVSAISAHSCVFRLRGASASSQIPRIIAQGRAALEAATAALYFYGTACVSFALYMLFCVCAVSTAIPFVPILGAICYMLILLPLVGFTLAWSEPDKDLMQRVPPKNDPNITFGRGEGWRLYKSTMLKAIPPALFPQLLHLIAFGELVIAFEPALIQSQCSNTIEQGEWAHVLRCEALKMYSGVARTSAGSLMLAQLILCTLAASASFVHGTIPIQELPPWKGNHIWVYSVLLGILLVVAILLGNLEGGSLSALPWYYYIIAIAMLPACIVWNELCKRVDRKHDMRSEKLRRLQFETRLGMWSPK